jgi:hypothetical protein
MHEKLQVCQTTGIRVLRHHCSRAGSGLNTEGSGLILWAWAFAGLKNLLNKSGLSWAKAQALLNKWKNRDIPQGRSSPSLFHRQLCPITETHHLIFTKTFFHYIHTYIQLAFKCSFCKFEEECQFTCSIVVYIHMYARWKNTVKTLTVSRCCASRSSLLRWQAETMPLPTYVDYAARASIEKIFHKNLIPNIT